MKRMILTILFSFGLVFAARAHEGHGDIGSIQPPKGGVVKSLETVHLEMVNLGKEIRIYVYDKEVKPQPTKDYPLTAKVQLPRKKGTQDLKLDDKGTHWVTQFDPKGAHRFDLILNIEQGGHKDTVTFTVEPSASSKK